MFAAADWTQIAITLIVAIGAVIQAWIGLLIAKLNRKADEHGADLQVVKKEMNGMKAELEVAAYARGVKSEVERHDTQSERRDQPPSA